MNGNQNSDHVALSTRAGRHLAVIGLCLAVLAAAAEILSGPGTRIGIWHYRTGLMLFRIAGVAGCFGAIISLLGGIVAGSRKLSVRLAAAGIVIGLVAAGIPWSWSRIAGYVPPIHDITTDANDPPAFSAILRDRKDTDNPSAYGGPALAEKQERAYPDIRPLVLQAAPEVVFDLALSVGRGMGWKIVSEDRKQGRIEATATTFWFGFKDDVVVRLTPVNEGTRVDIRSASRVGKSDVGTNAKRVREFLENMKTAR
jgi:uncharacterized protein (DUF1499 family)